MKENNVQIKEKRECKSFFVFFIGGKTFWYVCADPILGSKTICRVPFL